MQQYALGFLFSDDLNEVALIRKKRPEWQNGRLNGIGGKVEKEESPNNAMIREFHEETGYYLSNWEHKITISNEACDLFVFMAHAGDLRILQTVTDEEVIVLPVYTIHNNIDILPNLRWIIPLVLDKWIQAPTIMHFEAAGYAV